MDLLLFSDMIHGTLLVPSSNDLAQALCLIWHFLPFPRLVLSSLISLGIGLSLSPWIFWNCVWPLLIPSDLTNSCVTLSIGSLLLWFLGIVSFGSVMPFPSIRSLFGWPFRIVLLLGTNSRCGEFVISIIVYSAMFLLKVEITYFFNAFLLLPSGKAFYLNVALEETQDFGLMNNCGLSIILKDLHFLLKKITLAATVVPPLAWKKHKIFLEYFQLSRCYHCQNCGWCLIQGTLLQRSKGQCSE